ncbi:hypothetical protein ATSB10_15100 [Dyella thiooxydans]|uniref:GmrSD restriction endonucleases N-terminal domain-containing protein n=1 Tax=Dyella thiooxydans TaxID=445710 RepID=A0A160N0I8_9GAMM|nr:DUF262 domain-containing protein [Dyella thiooxydans]AND68964.1 hypothetical protein ATSB10_15100 [Dyella thiooxydans]
MTQLPAASARPDIIAVNDLLDGVVSGEYRVPRFQRPYVWSPEDMLQLFDSVLKGYPIGSLLIWQTERSDIASLKAIGPIVLPSDGPLVKSYVVDGHQRLATLLGVLKLPENHPCERLEDWRWWIAYDLKAEQFVHLKGTCRSVPLHFLPLRNILRTVDFARRTRDIAASSAYSETEASLLLDKADALQRALREYRLPLTILKNGSIDDAVTIFARINQRGRDMTPDQMLSALTYSDAAGNAFDLASSIDELLGSLRATGFGDLHRRIILQVVLAIAGLDFTRPSYERLVDRSSAARMRAAVQTASQALLETAGFLNEQVGLRTSKLLPYSSIFVLLSIFFAEHGAVRSQLSANLLMSLKKWFWATSFNGWFAGANTTDLRRAADILRAVSREEAGPEFASEFLSRPIRPFPTAFDRRSARIRASLLVQISNVLLDPKTGEAINGTAIFSSPDTADIPYFFPNQSRPNVSNPANRVILPAGYSRNARGVFAALPDDANGVEIQRSHLLSAAAMECLRNDDCDGFIAERERAITDFESSFLAQFDLQVDRDAVRASDEVDSV